MLMMSNKSEVLILYVANRYSCDPLLKFTIYQLLTVQKPHAAHISFCKLHSKFLHRAWPSGLNYHHIGVIVSLKL